MKKLTGILLLVLSIVSCSTGDKSVPENQAYDRMDWWREARFGMFIHWGLYAIPAGEWGEGKNHAEWIRTTAQIPLETYDKFVDEFNPVQFDAGEWVSMAKDAGMKYIVITSKHHDGFCLFDSEHTDFDVMSTPFKRDIMKELSDACAEQGLEMCWYHSIMDWHHPDYLPRRNWETNRSAEGAEYSRYIEYMKKQLAELTSDYGDIGVLWFDGEWEDTWTHDMGTDLYDYVRGLQDDIIVNNRVDKGRKGMQGMTESDEYRGDFGTPEQEIPATGLPGVDWETCMTMNNHWGYNKYDDNWKSNEDLIRKLVDIASKGGNFLLNVGPKADGTFPQESIDRLTAIGDWMDVYAESIYGTAASPFKELEWGRCTQKRSKGGARLYLHVFNWPKDGKLVVPGLRNKVKSCMLMDGMTKLASDKRGGDIIIDLPDEAPDQYSSVVILDVRGNIEIIEAPVILPTVTEFVAETPIVLYGDCPEGIECRYTLDGSDPDVDSPSYEEELSVNETTEVRVAYFDGREMISGVSSKTFTLVEPQAGQDIVTEATGLKYLYYEGEWDELPDFESLRVLKKGRVTEPVIIDEAKAERFGLVFEGYIDIPADGMYTFLLNSDDGSALFINGEKLIDNNYTHSATELSVNAALAKGYHSVRLEYFQKTGGQALELKIRSPRLGESADIGEFLVY